MIDGAKGVITNIVGSRDITLHEVGEAMNLIYSVCPEAHVFYGHAFDETLEDRIQITVIATGFPSVRTGNAAGKKDRLRPRTGQERRNLPRPVPGMPEDDSMSYPEEAEPAGNKRKNMEDELQKPAYLRMKPNRLRS
jgi:cell division protein FtsZ